MTDFFQYITNNITDLDILLPLIAIVLGLFVGIFWNYLFFTRFSQHITQKYAQTLLGSFYENPIFKFLGINFFRIGFFICFFTYFIWWSVYLGRTYRQYTGQLEFKKKAISAAIEIQEKSNFLNFHESLRGFLIGYYVQKKLSENIPEAKQILEKDLKHFFSEDFLAQENSDKIIEEVSELFRVVSCNDGPVERSADDTQMIECSFIESYHPVQRITFIYRLNRNNIWKLDQFIIGSS